MFTKEAVQDMEDMEEFDGKATFVDESLSFTGNTVSKGHLHVEGEIKGDVRCASVEVGQKGRISGDIVADEVVVGGRVVGSIRGGRVALKPDSHVEGDISYESLMIEHGAHFEGSLKRGDRQAGDEVEAKDGSDEAEASSANGSSKAESGVAEAEVAAE